jgi:hypothetical protein
MVGLADQFSKPDGASVNQMSVSKKNSFGWYWVRTYD